jgi:ribosome-binding factor A
MSKPRRRPTSSAAHRYPRTARLGELLREIIAEELERIGDERLELVAITSIDVDSELNRANVFYDAFRGEEVDAEVIEALTSHRIRLQAAIAKQIRARKTPILDFKPDMVLRSAEQIDRILRANPLPDRPEMDASVYDAERIHGAETGALHDLLSDDDGDDDDDDDIDGDEFDDGDDLDEAATDDHDAIDPSGPRG